MLDEAEDHRRVVGCALEQQRFNKSYLQKHPQLDDGLPSSPLSKRPYPQLRRDVVKVVQQIKQQNMVK